MLALTVIPAVWHVVDFEEDIDVEFPSVTRPTFSRVPPSAYRLAEPGDTLDRIMIYFSAAGLVLSGAGLVLSRGGGLWPAAFCLCAGRALVQRDARSGIRWLVRPGLANDRGRSGAVCGACGHLGGAVGLCGIGLATVFITAAPTSGLCGSSDRAGHDEPVGGGACFCRVATG